jgi:1,4-dihydroxy-2-naphthoate octaprenyltransferase
MRYLRFFLQLSRPLNIINAVLLYLLGISIAHYLSGHVDWSVLLYGLVWVIVLLLATQFLNEFFDPMVLINNPTIKHTPFSGVSGAVGVGKIPRQVVFWVGLAFLAIATSLMVLIIKIQGINQAALFISGLIFIGELLFALPPVRLVSSGYGELLISIINVSLIPALAYLMQGHELHRLLAMVVFPMTTLHLGMLLALEFSDYASDLKQVKRALLIRIGWQRGMLLHNVLILVSFVLFGIAFILGLPLSVGWPIIFVFPVGLYQVWMMYRISEGAKPNWNLLTLVAISTFGLAAYILTFAFWTH